MTNVTLLDPTSQGDVSAKFLAPRLDSLDGKVMGLLNITKNGSDIFLERVEELMRERFDLADVLHVKKTDVFAARADGFARQSRRARRFRR